MKCSRLLFILLCLVILTGCSQDRQAIADQMIEARATERLEEYISSETQKCQSKMIEEASRIADSLLRENPLVTIRLDSLLRPPIPPKPRPPEFQRRKDSIRIEPILPAKKE